MDRTSNGEASMYLSFDSESTMNSLAYKTTNDISSVSNKEEENSQDSHMNSTLEALKDESDCLASFMKTVKKVEKLAPPLPACASVVFPKNILKEYNAVCSTPTKEQLMRTVQISRGSEGEKCIDLGEAFRGMEDEKQVMQLQLMSIAEENKENTTHVESEEVLTLSSGSSSSSVECVVTSVIYQKMTTALSTTEEESIEELVADATPKRSREAVDTPILSVNADATPILSGDADTTPKPPSDDSLPKIINVGNGGVKDGKQLAKATNSISANNKPKQSIPVLKNIRKSMCEPDLQANRPSRIMFNGNKRTSIAAVCTNKTKADNEDIGSDIPKLLATMLKITNPTTKKEKTIIEKPCESENDKLKPTRTAPKGRISIIPSQVQTGDKRPCIFAQRGMSVLVKTTLNSPARKIARKSTLPNGSQIRRSVMPQPALTRRSVMPQSALARRSVMPPAAAKPVTKNDALGVRRSMLPMVNTKTAMTTTRTTVGNTMCTSNVLNTASSKENTTKAKQTMCTSNYSQSTEEKPSATNNKPKTSGEMGFVCNVCACKFRIKSLLDAHKRFHEDDMPASLIKKPAGRTMASVVAAPSANQCKYCDKKFALVRALHIHLMENCTKIPPGAKRKLQFTEMNHVGKAQLPEIFHHSHQSNASSQSSSLSNSQMNSIGNSNAADAVSQLVQKSHSNLSSAPMSSTESLLENKDITIIANKMCTSVSGTQMAPPSVNKVKVNTIAHAGVYRTPNKSIVCHTCKKSFKTIIEHISHNLIEHSKTAPVNGNSNNEPMETSANSST